MKYFLTAIISVIILVGGIFTGEHLISKNPTVSFGSFNPVQASQFTLAGAGITNNQTTIQLASFNLPDPNKTPITMSMFGSIGYGVLDPQTSKIENISFTGVTQNLNGSATLTGVIRGISFYSPFVSISVNMLSHAGGSNFILSNSAAFYGQFAFPNNTQTWLATQTYGSTTPPVYDAEPIWANFSVEALASIAYVNSVVAAGAANASETVKGIVQLATNVQLAAGTSIGSTAARLGIPNSLATSTPTVACTSGCVPVAVNGKLSQLFLDLTQTFAFLNAITAPTSTLGSLNVGLFNATSTANFYGTTNFPGTVTGISGKIYLNTAPGTINGGSSASTTIFSVTVPGNTLSTSNFLTFDIPLSTLNFVNTSPAQPGTNLYWEVGYGTGTTTGVIFNNSTANAITGTGKIEIKLAAAGSANSQLISFNILPITNQSAVATYGGNLETNATLSQNSTNPLTLLLVLRYQTSSGGNNINPVMVTGVFSK